MERLRLDDLGQGVRLLTLTDPSRRNALGELMHGELVDVAATLRADPHARALVVTGEPPAFCAGADLSAMFGDDRPVDETHASLRSYYEAFFAIRGLPFPTIAAVNGAAVGAGLNLAMCCDLRLAGEKATFGATFAKIGLHPGGGSTWFLVRALGPSRALRVLLLGETLDAAQAVTAGLADGPYDDVVGAAVELAQAIAGTDPALARHIKRAVGLAVEPGSFDAVVEYESWAQAASASSPEVREWVARFRQ